MAPKQQAYTLPRLLYGLAQFAADQTGLPAVAPMGDLTHQITWSDYDQGPLTTPYVSISKSSARNDGFPNEYLREVPTQQRLTITQTTTGEFVVANGIWSETRTTVIGGDSLEDTRDKFLIAWNATIANTREPLIFAADGAADILVTAKAHAIPDIEAVQGCTLADPAPIVANAEVNSVQRIYRVRFTFYGFEIDGDDGEEEYVSQLQTALESKAGIAFLEPYGLGPQGSPTEAQDVTAAAGPLLVRTVFFDASIVTRRTTYNTNLGSSAVIDLVDPPVIEGVIG